MRKILCFALAALGSLAIAGAAHATACFDWDCSNRFCTFDTSCSNIPDGSTFQGYKLIFGDGTSTVVSNTAFYTHTYGSSYDYPYVTVEVNSFGGTSKQTITCQIVTRDIIISPPPPTSGRCATELP